VKGLDPVDVWKRIWVLTVILLIWTSSAETFDNAMYEGEVVQFITILKQKAAEAGNGMVRVIVKVRPVSSSEPGMSHNPEQEIESSKAKVAALMRREGVSIIEPLDKLPLIVLELNAEQLDRLSASNLVESIQEDRIEGAY
jgi:hypothetical protein